MLIDVFSSGTSPSTGVGFLYAIACKHSSFILGASSYWPTHLQSWQTDEDSIGSVLPWPILLLTCHSGLAQIKTDVAVPSCSALSPQDLTVRITPRMGLVSSRLSSMDMPLAIGRIDIAHSLALLLIHASRPFTIFTLVDSIMVIPVFICFTTELMWFSSDFLPSTIYPTCSLQQKK
jgi:hypothetical protein